MMRFHGPNGHTEVSTTNPIPMGSPVHTWTDLTPAVLASGNNTLIAAPSGSNLNIIESIGFQNIGAVSRTLIVKNGTDAVRQWVVPAGATVEVTLEQGKEWRFDAALIVNASAGTDLWVTGGRYRVGTS